VVAVVATVMHVSLEARMLIIRVHHDIMADATSAKSMAIGPENARNSPEIRQKQHTMLMPMQMHSQLCW
jgi:hypothetical protein